MIEIPVPLLFFSPVRRLRLGSFYLQVDENSGLSPKNIIYRAALINMPTAFFYVPASIISVFWVCFAGFASGSDHFVRKLQFLQPPDFDPLPVTSGRPTRSLLVTQAVHRQRRRYEREHKPGFCLVNLTLLSLPSPGSASGSWLCYLLELVVWSLLIAGTILCFDVQLDTTKMTITSRTGAL